MSDKKTFMNDSLEETKHRQLELKLWLPATAKDIQGLDMRTSELSIPQLNPHYAFQLADRLGKSIGKLVAVSKCHFCGCTSSFFVSKIMRVMFGVALRPYSSPFEGERSNWDWKESRIPS